jgi:hypothetical protein
VTVPASGGSSYFFSPNRGKRF